MWVKSLTSLAAKRVLNVLSCEELRKLPKNIQRCIRRHMFVEEQHHVFKNVWAGMHRGRCKAYVEDPVRCDACFDTAIHRGECPCFYGFDDLLEVDGFYFNTCPGPEMLSLTFLAVAAVHKTLTPKKLKLIPQELHIMFRERVSLEEQLKFFGDYKQCGWTEDSYDHYTLISYEKKHRLLKMDIYEEGKLVESRSYTHNTPKGTNVLTNYWDNGAINSVKSYKDFQYHGSHSGHFASGTLYQKHHYWNNKKHGMSMVNNGRPQPEIGFYKNNVQVWGYLDILGIYWSMTSCCGQNTDS